MSRTVWLWPLAIFVGIQFGAGLYEKLAIVPLWADVSADQVFSAMESSGMKRAGRAFWAFVSPVVALLAVINLVVAWRSNATYRRWWLAAAAAMTTMRWPVMGISSRRCWPSNPPGTAGRRPKSKLS